MPTIVIQDTDLAFVDGCAVDYDRTPEEVARAFPKGNPRVADLVHEAWRGNRSGQVTKVRIPILRLRANIVPDGEVPSLGYMRYEQHLADFANGVPADLLALLALDPQNWQDLCDWGGNSLAFRVSAEYSIDSAKRYVYVAYVRGSIGLYLLDTPLGCDPFAIGTPQPA